MKITVVSPHRDDAAFSLGLTIGTWIEAGHKVEVLNCFTRSEYSPFGERELVHANDLRTYVTAVRAREDERWSRAYPAGKLTLRDVNLRDAPQRRNCAVDQVCSLAVKEDDAAIGKIRRVLAERVREAVVLPLGVGGHVDHLTARVAGEAIRVEGLAMAFYEDLPYAARPGMDRTIEERVAEIEEEVSETFAGDAVDAEAAIRRKRKLALYYDTQIDSEVTEQIAGFCVRYGGRERLWGNEAWRKQEHLTWGSTG